MKQNKVTNDKSCEIMGNFELSFDGCVYPSDGGYTSFHSIYMCSTKNQLDNADDVS